MLPTSREWIVLLTVVAVTSLIPSFWVGAAALGGIAGLLVYRVAHRAALRRTTEQAALSQSVERAQRPRLCVVK